jgi:hypothetical protein
MPTRYAGSEQTRHELARPGARRRQGCLHVPSQGMLMLVERYARTFSCGIKRPLR